MKFMSKLYHFFKGVLIHDFLLIKQINTNIIKNRYESIKIAMSEKDFHLI
jgi:hypothetical protein